MTLQSASPPSAHSSERVGNAFVEQYYHVLHTKPEMAHLFYKESSHVSRQDSNGVMTSVITLQGIEEMILSLNFNEYRAEIMTADSQDLYGGGVMVVVFGNLYDKDNLKRKFTQAFCLAPQESGFFVSNDMFHYLENTETEPSQINAGAEGTDVPATPLTPDQETPRVADHFTPESATSPAVDDRKADHFTPESATSPTVDDRTAVEFEITLVNESHSIDEEVDFVESKSQSTGTPIPESSSVALEVAPKKSYASIVGSQTKKSRPEVTKVNDGNSKISVPVKTLKVEPFKSEETSSVSVATPVVPETPNETKNSPTEVEGYSIYVRNLPYNLAVSELEEVFSEFGPIKQGGVQVVSQMHLGKCFGFVEFLSVISMEDAIKASPISVHGRRTFVDIKKTTARAPADGIGRIQSGRGGFANNNFRNREYFGDDYHDYGKKEYNNRGDSSGRGRGRARNEEGYHYQRGRDEEGYKFQRGRDEEGYKYQRGRGGNARSVRSIQNPRSA